MTGKGKEIEVQGQASASGKTSTMTGDLTDYPMENDWEYVHGRVDPGVDESINLVEGVTVKESKTLWEGFGLRGEDGAVKQERDRRKLLSLSQVKSQNSQLTLLPSELIEHILSFLAPLDLNNVSATSRCLHAHGISDHLWQQLVQANVPGDIITNPAPYANFRELYIAHNTHWFLPKYKIWFSDYFLTGKLIVARYDPRRAVIEGYRLLAERPPPTFDSWDHDDEVVVHSFNPKCRLHLDEPVVQLNPCAKSEFGKPFSAEKPMYIQNRTSRTVFTNFILTRSVRNDPRPYLALWPPVTIPAPDRVRNSFQEGSANGLQHPASRAEICDTNFRIKRWIQMAGGRAPAPGVQMGEETTTFSTLDPYLYTPTETKPFRGIWVGDYSGHGCEFLLMHQPDDQRPFDIRQIPRRRIDESEEDYNERVRQAKMYRGRLEAIKLTGDPNIPRGEYTFVSDDIGEEGFVRVSDEEPFKGARIVKSRGHIAARMFTNDKYIASQLIMISPNRLAQYWVGFGHISFFERVNIDDFITAPKPKPFHVSPSPKLPRSQSLG